MRPEDPAAASQATPLGKLRPIRNAGSARPRLLVLEGAVLLSGGRFDAAVAQGIAPAPHQANISDILCADRCSELRSPDDLMNDRAGRVWVGDESGRNWQMHSVSYQHNALVGCKSKSMNVSVHGKPTIQKIE